MRNLTVHCQSIHNLNEAENFSPEFRSTLQSKILCCIHPDHDNIYILESNILYEIVVGKNIKLTPIPITIPDIKNDEPVDIEYHSDESALYCAYKSGILLKIFTQLPYNQEVVAHMDKELSCIKLSPDQEILVLVANNDTVFIMIPDLEIISKEKLDSSDFGEKQFVTAGWGHKETQFHGSEGKAAARAKSEIIGKTENDSGSSSITWRGDGAMFAVSYFNRTIDARQFKIFNRQGVLQYTSELIHGLEENISWKPSGNLIATTQKLPNKHVVSFFEKNGLMHRNFSLPFSINQVEVKSLMWSPDSDVLAIWCKEINTNYTMLQLYTENNYHWYLKSTIRFSPKNPLIYYTWSTKPRMGKCLLLLTLEKLIVCSFRWTINHTRGKDSLDKSVVGVLDGNRVLLTGFRVGIVPPPMCHQSLEINQAINECIFSPCCESIWTPKDSWRSPNSFFCLLENNRLALCAPIDENTINYRHLKSYDIEWELSIKIIDDNFPYSLHHFLWIKADVILCSADVGTHSYLCVINLENMNSSNGRVVVREGLMLDDHIHHIVHSPDANIAYLNVGNHILRYTHGEGIIDTEISIEEHCNQMEVVEIENRHVIVALDSRNRLYLDGKIVANNITSLCTHPNFLLLTTLQHSLVSVNMNGDGFGRLSKFDLSAKPWTNNYTEEESLGLSLRRLERASSLVAVIPQEGKCILQMPRGNLETIQPRSHSFVILKTHLNVRNYFQAFDIMRKQRINLIYDHNPKLFSENVEKFIDDIKNPNWLNLFISELQEEDVTQTIYKSCYSEDEHKVRSTYKRPEGSKVEMVCELLREVMERKTKSRNLVQPILTCLVKNQHISGLEAALRKISEFKKNGETSTESHQQSAEEALKYLLYLVDVNKLFDIALGMYELELTKFIGSKSQKDPKEYIAYLNSLSELEENYRKYKINKDLKRYESALNYIVRCPTKFDECLELIHSQNLYAQAVKAFSRNTKEYTEVTKIFAEYLMRNRRYREAGLMYERSEDLDHALQAYKKTGNWQQAIIISTKMNMEPAQLNELYRDLVAQLRDDRRYRDAAEISFTYLKQPEEAISLLCEGRDWNDALRIVYTSKRLDLLETHVKLSIHEHGMKLYFQINENTEEFLKHRKRLTVVRKEKERLQALSMKVLSEGNETIGADYSDLLSETSSTTGSTSSMSSFSSRSSERSYRSSKNRRKHERKVLSIKEGSAYEDLALIRALHINISNTYAQKKEIGNVNQVLLHFHLDDIAEKIQSVFMNLLKTIETYKYEIWPKDSTIGSCGENATDYIQSSLLEAKFKYPPEADPNHWVLELFPQCEKANNIRIF